MSLFIAVFQTRLTVLVEKKQQRRLLFIYRHWQQMTL